jgi:hypothetical protein
MVEASKENTAILISLGGTSAVDKVRTKWQDNARVQDQVRRLAIRIAAQVKTWAGEE